MGALVKGTTNSSYVAGSVKIKRVTIIVAGAVASVIHVHGGQNTANDPDFIFVGFLGGSTVLEFDGLLFGDGFTVEPDGACSFYVVEYEPMVS